MKKFTRLMAAGLTLGTCALASARTVSVPTFVCNPGAVVKVPIFLDDAAGCACVDVQLAYDAQVLVPVTVEPGTLEAVFSDDQLLRSETPGLVNAGLFATNDSAAVSGTVAVVTFRVREGTAGLFSDLTVAEVTLGKANGLNADAAERPTKVSHGMVRVMAATASVGRLEKAETVCAGTALGQLTLTSGDGLAAADDLSPIVVAGTVVAPEAIPVAAPANGWRTATYRLLTTQSADLSFALQGLSEEDGYELTSTTDGSGRTTYLATVTVCQPNVVPGETIERNDAAEAILYAEQVNADPELKAVLLRAPAESVSEAGLPDYQALFSAVAEGKNVTFVLNAEGTQAVVRAETTASTNALTAVLAVTGEEGTADVTITRPLQGFYYSFKQGGDVMDLGFRVSTDANKVGGRDDLVFTAEKFGKARFFQTLVTPKPVKVDP